MIKHDMHESSGGIGVMADDSGYIHPTEQAQHSGFPQGGLTKREWFAGQAMIALMSSKRISDELISHKDRSAVVLSAMAFDLADAMILESRK